MRRPWNAGVTSEVAAIQQVDDLLLFSSGQHRSEEMTGEGGDPITRKMLEEITANEEEHADDLADLPQNLPKNMMD